MNRPKTLSIKKLKSHARQLKKQYKFKMKPSWQGEYNVAAKTVKCPPIKTCIDYIVFMHEVGHHVTDKLHKINKEFRDINKQIKSIRLQKFKNKKEVKVANSRLNEIDKRVKQLHRSYRRSRWIFHNEMLAWQWAFRNSLIWSEKIERKMIECMASYWLVRVASKTPVGARDEKWLKFVEKYIEPITK